MARRRQNLRDIQAKKPVTTEPTPPTYLDRALGNPQTRRQRDEAVNRLLIRITLGAVAIVAVILFLAWGYDQLIVPNQAVARVNGQAITVASFRDRVRFERARITQLAVNTQQRAQQQAQQYAAVFQQDEQTLLKQILDNEPQYQKWVNEINFPDQLGQRVLNDMIDDVLVSQEAAKLNIAVDDASVLSAQDKYFGYDPTLVALIGTPATETLTPTISPTPFVSPTPTVPPTATLPATETPTLAPITTAEATIAAAGTSESNPVSTADATLSAGATSATTVSAAVTAEAIIGTPTETPTPVPSATLAPTEVEATYQASVRTYRQELANASRVGSGELDKYFREQALRDAVGKSLLGNNKTIYVNARHILVDDKSQEKAQEILDALKNGASFADLAIANSTDTGSGAKGGELGWTPAVNFVKEFKQASLDLPIGQISDLIKTQFGYHILQVRAREEREIPEADRASVQASLFNTWLTDLRTANEANIERYNWTDYVPQNEPAASN